MFDAALKSNENGYKNIFIKMINYTIFIEKRKQIEDTNPYTGDNRQS